MNKEYDSIVFNISKMTIDDYSYNRILQSILRYIVHDLNIKHENFNAVPNTNKLTERTNVAIAKYIGPGGYHWLFLDDNDLTGKGTFAANYEFDNILVISELSDLQNELNWRIKL